ncbi:MAG: tRNA preQ1(34) S-adenosylmethionine ribosyltransferase-isomerase QueA, partial [Desulfobacterales bacterium]|nr:tRNA preQ1(34) S-adenosylmethionine ribosyltransferase-isomerase QueA [Desulfobacterales bacterium]
MSDYDYTLPDELIAQAPCEDRSNSRLLRVHRPSGALSHHHFNNLLSFLNAGDLLVVNNTKVIPARLMGKKATGGQVEVLIIDYAAGMAHMDRTGEFQCDCLIRASRRPKPGAVLLMDGGITAKVVAHNERISTVAFPGGDAFIERLKASGQIPLPPYIKRMENDQRLAGQDKTDYQTVYARTEGAVAAPTAGLHFTAELMSKLRAKGVGVAELTLHVGYGTFVPVKVDDIRDHDIHSEFFTVSEEVADRINKTKTEGGRVIAVGTTSVRTLEFLA